MFFLSYFFFKVFISNQESYSKIMKIDRNKSYHAKFAVQYNYL